MSKSGLVDTVGEAGLVPGTTTTGYGQMRDARSDCIRDDQWQAFLDHLAMTCNVRGAAREAGFNAASAYKRRARDPAFAVIWDQARETGMATVKMMLVARAMGAHGYEPGEDFAPDPATMDAELSYKLVAQYEKADAQAGRGPRGGAGRVPIVVASEDEACAEILKRLKVLGIRLNEKPLDSSC